MPGNTIRCRVAACSEDRGDGMSWSFYLINDSAAPLNSAVLNRTGSEWGDLSHNRPADVQVENLAPGAHALIWRDDGEFRIELSLRIHAFGREAKMRFEFPKLYRQGDLPIVDTLERPGWEESAESLAG